MLFLAADHAGFKLKQQVTKELIKRDVIFEDLGTFSDEPVDYPGYAKRLAKEVVRHNGVGILFCGSGQGMAMAANRFKGARTAVVWTPAMAKETREDNDANILSLPARFLSYKTAWQIIAEFLSTPFSKAERHKRRIAQLDDLSGGK